MPIWPASHLHNSLLLLRLFRARLLGRRHLFGQHLFHALLLLDQECAHDAHADALATSRATIGAVDRALALLQPAVLDWAKSRNANKALLAITAVRPLRPL